MNVGGFKQSVDQSTLLRFPHTRLGRLLRCHSEEAILELCDDYSVADKEYYFDRNPSLFRYVLNFYYTGKLHVMEELCVFSFCQEIEYWGINELFIDSCCSNRYQERKEENHEKDWDQKSNDVSTDSSFEESSLFEKELEKFDQLRFGQLRKKIWIRMENPAYCLSAKLIAISSLSVVLASIVAMCVHSMSEFQNEDGEVDDPVLEGVEVACIAWFTGELAIRLAAAPCQKKFWKNPLNIIDFVSIIPFYATLAVDTKEEESEDIENMGKVVQILRLMRIFRILKLARHSVGLRSLGATLRHSYTGWEPKGTQVCLQRWAVLRGKQNQSPWESRLHQVLGCVSRARPLTSKRTWILFSGGCLGSQDDKGSEKPLLGLALAGTVGP